MLVTIHCGSRGLGHQIGSEFLKEMAVAASELGINLPDRDLACAPLRSELGERYLGAMRAAINCALANREILGHIARQAVRRFFPQARLDLLFDVSDNTCKAETHIVDRRPRDLYVHRKGATRAFGPGHPSLPEPLCSVGQPVLIGGSMGTASYVLVEDKIVQEAVVYVLEAIYEEDFLGFSYGFRPGCGQHDALDALHAGIYRKQVNWVLDLDIQGFFDATAHSWMIRFLEHRIAPPFRDGHRPIRPITLDDDPHRTDGRTRRSRRLVQHRLAGRRT